MKLSKIHQAILIVLILALAFICYDQQESLGKKDRVAVETTAVDKQ